MKATNITLRASSKFDSFTLLTFNPRTGSNDLIAPLIKHLPAHGEMRQEDEGRIVPLLVLALGADHLHFQSGRIRYPQG